MRGWKISVLFLSLMGLVLATWVAAGPQIRRIDDVVLKNAGKTAEEWLTYGLTPGETRYSPLKQIDTTNVSRFGLAGLTTSAREAAIRKQLRFYGMACCMEPQTGA